MIKKVYSTKPEQQYFLAIDNSPNRTQKHLIESISSGIGTGLVKSEELDVDKIPKTDFSINLAGRQVSTLTIDLNMKPSALMVTDEGAEDAQPADFTWHCEKGLAQNIQLVKNEFCEVNKLKPIKTFVTGPPLSGKSHFSKKLSEEYNIPHIQIKNLIKDIPKLDPQSELAQKINTWTLNHGKERFPNFILCELV